MSGVTAAARCTIADIVSSDHLSALFKAILAETASLGRARGVALPDTIEAEIWSMVESMPPGMRASTAIDLEKGRPLEIEWVSGAVDRLSQAAGLQAPVNRTIYALLTPYQQGRR